MAFRVMTEHDRLVIIGRTGGGKTYAGLWQLSLQPVDQFTWVIFDIKSDENIARIPYAKSWTLEQGPPPSGGGIYIVRPLTGQDAQMDDFLRDVWNQENIGLYIDEGMYFRGSRAYQDIQVQGRSKNIPCITLTQLPVYLPRPVFTEASFLQVFHVLDRRYRKVISEFSDISDEEMERLRRFQSIYYDVVRNEKTKLGPAPDISRTFARFAEMLKPPSNDFNGEEPELNTRNAPYRRYRL